MTMHELREKAQEQANKERRTWAIRRQWYENSLKERELFIAPAKASAGKGELVELIAPRASKVGSK